MGQYLSPFDIIQSKDKNLFDMSGDPLRREQIHRYSGTLEQCIDSTIEALDKVLSQGVNNVSGEILLEIILMNARIIRGILDVKFFPNSEKYIESVQSVIVWIKASLEVYCFNSGAVAAITELKTGISSILNTDILQRYDAETWKAMNPQFSKITQQKISQEVGRGDYLFVALGHGGIATGFDIFLRLQASLDGRGDFYPIRFSRAKKRDKVPKIQNEEEKKYIESMLQGRILIIFDEDASSGNTLNYAKKYFEENFSGFSRVVLYSNIGVFGIQR